ncbi:hypothetical protein CFC21_033964, partial [Triticum aestivum]
GAAAAAAAG